MKKRIVKELYESFKEAEKAAMRQSKGALKRTKVKVSGDFQLRSSILRMISVMGTTPAFVTPEGDVFAWWNEYSEPGKEKELMGPVLESALYSGK